MRYLTSTFILISLLFTITACSEEPELSKSEVLDLVRDYAMRDVIDYQYDSTYCKPLSEKINDESLLMLAVYNNQTAKWTVEMPPSVGKIALWNGSYVVNKHPYAPPDGFRKVNSPSAANYFSQTVTTYSWIVDDKSQDIKRTGSKEFRVYLYNAERYPHNSVQVLKGTAAYQSIYKQSNPDLESRPFC